MKSSKLWWWMPWSLAIACGGDVTEADSLSGTGDDSSSQGDSIDPDDSSGATNPDTSSGGGSVSADSSSGSVSADSGTTTTDEGTTTDDDAGSESESGTTGGMSCMDDLACDDFLPCNGVETCEGGECAPGVAVVCDDGVACTVDACDENTAECFAVAVDANCDDGSFCNGAESCDAVLDCQPGTDIACDDGIACTTDSCDEGTDACAFEPDDSNCDDGAFCTGVETCNPLLGCQDDTDFGCEDFVACTLDTCDEANDQCDHEPDDGLCGDGVICNGDEVCDPMAGCGDGTPVVCADDGVACTVESCDEATGDCQTELDNAQCAMGEFCSDGGCVVGDPCNNAGQCQDGLACNGAEICAQLMGMGPTVCQPGTPIDCNDDVDCTSDACQEPGACDNVQLDGLCADGDPCNGDEVCTAAGCQGGDPLVCDDGVGCTDNDCIEDFGCSYPANHPSCDDGTFCNGEEYCDPIDDCQSTGALQCPDDGIPCTTDVCDEQIDGCAHTPDDAQCSCGEECLPAFGGCATGCTISFCDGHLYACGDCTDNDDDCDIDDHDSNCFGPCSDNESGLDGLIPGQDNAPCKHDCYWDGNSGSGNDDCYWSHECDPLEPSASTCEYDPDASIPGYAGNMDCTNALDGQSAECEAFCEELTPNGCDCFGCCMVDLDNGSTVTVYLGSKVDGDGDSTCTVDVLDDPALCHPCTQVPACINTCDDCEVCFGDDDPLPPECGGEQVCSREQQQCGQIGQDQCPEGQFCLTGCCQQF